MAVPLQRAELGWGGKKSLCAREQRFANTALALGWRVALIKCVCMSFSRVIQHDAARKEEQPLKHSGAFSLQGFWCWGRGRRVSLWLWRTLELRPRMFTQQPLTAGPIYSHRELRAPSTASPGTAQSSDRSQCSSICPQREGACYFHFYSVIFQLFVLFSLHTWVTCLWNS